MIDRLSIRTRPPGWPVMYQTWDKLLFLHWPVAAELGRLGVTVRTRTGVSAIEDGAVTLRCGDATERLPAHTVLWAAGVKASPLGEMLAKATGAELDRGGRVKVAPDLTVPRHPEIFVIGDLAHVTGSDGTPLPGLAAVARQQGLHVGKVIHRRLRRKWGTPFRYRARGNLAVIWRNAAVADLGAAHFDGFAAWLLWLLIHIYYLIGFENKLLVTVQWGWNYFTRTRGAQLITGKDLSPFAGPIRASAEGVRPLPRRAVAWARHDGHDDGGRVRDVVEQVTPERGP